MIGPVVQAAFPVACPLSPREFDHITRAIPDASDAVPATATIELGVVYVPPVDGAVMLSCGSDTGVPERAVWRRIVTVRVTTPYLESLATTVIVLMPFAKVIGPALQVPEPAAIPANRDWTSS